MLRSNEHRQHIYDMSGTACYFSEIRCTLGNQKIWKYFGENSEIFAIAIHAVHTGGKYFGGKTMYGNISEKTPKFLQY